ncbi:MAG: serine/threonine protein kinase [Myxococcota bacterium]|nr:serine/threonine protein kinase [Myxococcota bacterium]
MDPPAQDTPPADRLVGATLGGKYLIEYRLARGGTGAVYRAIQHPIHRPVAIKVMRPDLPEEELENFEQRFLKEASQMGSLQHPNIVTVHDFGRTEDGACFIVMELLEGETLKDALRSGPMSLESGLEVSLQLTRGLRHAHRAGMIHRDIKAGNAMLIRDPDGRFQTKLLDFGLVKSLDEVSVTGAGSFIGTPHYASPEQARGLTADFRSDIYSLGVLMYRIFTGRLPFYRRNPMAIAIAHIQEPFPPMGHRAPESDVPEAIEAVVRRCMEKAPGDRFPDAAALFEALNELRQQLAPNLTSIETISLPAVEPLPSHGGRWLAASGLVGGIVVLASVGAVVWSGMPSEPVATRSGPNVEVVAEPEPELVHEVPVLVSSEPSGAVVFLDDLNIGTTPHAGKLRLGSEEPMIQTLRLESTGYRTAEAELDLSGETATAHLILEKVPVVVPKKKPVPPPVGPDVTADGVRFTSSEASAAVRFINTAPEAELRSAGIAGRQVNIILGARPFSSIGAFASTHFIGEKTVEAVRRAAL